MDKLLQDLRYATRVLTKSPGFTLAAVLTLALGIGANTAIFSVINGVLLRPLPYEEPDQLVTLWEMDEGGTAMHVTAANFLDWQAQSRSFSELAVHSSYDFGGPATVLGGREATRAWTAGVSADFFRVFRVQPVLGRGFAPDEMQAGASGVVVVTHRFWQEQLGANPNLAGKTLEVYGERRQVVGVMPPGFSYPQSTDLWVPITPAASEGRRAHNWQVIGRLRDGASLTTARWELNQLARRIRAEHGKDVDAVAVKVTRLQDQLVGPIRQPLLLLLGAAVLVLLVACTNLASTLLARGTARQREIGVRVAMGAGRSRIVRQLVTESALLSVLGAAAGLLLADLLLQVLTMLAPSLPQAEGIRLDGRVLAFTLLLALLTALLCGLVPALRAAGSNLGAVLRSGTRGGSEGRRSGVWGVLVGGEIAMALVLLVGAGLLIRSFWGVLGIDPGFRTENVLTVELALPDPKYSADPDIASYYRSVITELGELPGVESVGVINHLPLGGLSWNGSFAVEGRGEESGYADYRVASGGYFDAMGIRLLRGRPFDDRDHAQAPDAVIINRAMAQQFWPGQDPIGQRIGNLANDSWIYGDRWLTVVGIVEDVRHGSLTAPVRPTLFVHYLQRPSRASSAFATLRTGPPPATLVSPVRERLRALDADVPFSFAAMSERVAGSVADRRFILLILGLFAAVALLLAAVGIYGVVWYSVERRTREMGIRVALGAEPRGVLGLVLRESMRVVIIGMVIGIAGALALTRLMRSFLYEVSPMDMPTFGSVALLLAGVALLASYLPARRAARVDPMTALRSE
jgi:putative ABC transport system permease protein